MKIYNLSTGRYEDDRDKVKVYNVNTKKTTVLPYSNETLKRPASMFKAPTLTGGSASSIKKPVLNQPKMADFKKLDYAQSKDLKPAQNLAKSRGMFGTLGKTVPTPTLMTGTAKRAQDSRKEYENAMIFASPDEARQIRQNYEKQRQNQLNLITPMLTNQRAQRQILPQLPKDFKKQLSKDLSAQIPQREFGVATEEFMNDLNAQLEADMGLREQPVTRQSISQAEENLMALQRQSVPFAATSGFVKSMADLPAVMIPFTPEQRARYNEPFAQTTELHPLAYGAGQFAGEAIKYGTAAKMVEGMPVLQEALGRFGGKVSSALGGKVSAEVISRLAAGRISDLPLDVIYAAQETDNPQDFAKNLGINTAMGLGTDIGLETIGKLWRMGKAAAASNAPGGENWYNRKMDELKDPFGVAPETKPGYNQGGGDLSGQRGSRSEGSVGNFGEGGLSQSSAVDTGRTRAGGQADGIDSEILRRKWELDTAETEIIRAGKTEYRIKKVPEAQISPIAKETQQILSEYGVPATISGEPVIARNGERFVQTGEGSTIGTGRVLIQNDHGFTPKNMGNHEALHASKFLYPDIHEAVETAITDGGIRVIKDGKINPVLQLIIDKYSKTHPNIDSISDQRELINEIAAQIAGLNAIDPDFTREKFGDILYDYDGALSAIQNALDEMKRRTGRSGAAGGNTRFTPLPEVKRPMLPESDPILQSRNWEKPKVDDSVFRLKNTLNEAEGLGGESVSAKVPKQKGGAAAAPVNEPEIPKGFKERGYAETIRTKTDLPDELKNEFVTNPEFYKQLSNKETLNRAQQAMQGDLQQAKAQFDALLARKDPAAVPLGNMLAKQYAEDGQKDAAVDVLRQMSARLTESGQFSQAAAIGLLKNDPDTALRYIQRQIDTMNAEGSKKYRRWKDFELSDGEMRRLAEIEPGDEAAIRAAFEEIGARISKEYPVTAMEKLTEFSHVMMLLNPRTLARNYLANVAMLPMQKTAAKVSALGQGAYHLVNPDYKPTQSFFVGEDSKKLAKEVYESIKGQLDDATVGKWENTLLNSRKDKDVFKMRKYSPTAAVNHFLPEDKQLGRSIMENIRRFTYDLLDKGDKPFMEKNFVDRLGSFIEARKIRNIADIPDDAISIATSEALKATFKDDNAITGMVQEVKRALNKAGGAGEVFMPFTKTPANITARALDFSPAGLLTLHRKYVKSGKDASVFIDELSKAVTGTAAIAVGYNLAKSGLITGTLSDNKRKAAFQKQQGMQAYSLKVGNRYISYDWAQPAATPLLIGAVLYDGVQKQKEGGDFDLAEDWPELVLKSVYASGDAILNQSVFQNVKDALGGYGSPTENVVMEVVEWPQRLVPSAFGAAARAIDPTVRSTFSKGDPLKTQLDAMRAKIPGLSKDLPASYDTWGNPITREGGGLYRAVQQFAAPWNTGNVGKTPLDKEVMRLYDALGDESILPRKAEYSITYDGKTKDLTNREYSEYQKRIGQESYEIVGDLFDLEAYRAAPDEMKAQMLKDAYDYANAFAKADIVGHKPDDWMLEAYEAAKRDIEVADFIAQRKVYNSLKSTGDSTKTEQYGAMLAEDQRYDEKQKELLFSSITNSSKLRDFSNMEAFEVSLLSDSQQEAYKNLKNQMSLDQFQRYESLMEGVESTKKNGKTVNGSLKENRRRTLVNAGMTDKAAKEFLTVRYGYKWD